MRECVAGTQPYVRPKSFHQASLAGPRWGPSPGRRAFRVTSTVSERLAGSVSRGRPNINHPPCAPRG